MVIKISDKTNDVSSSEMSVLSSSKIYNSIQIYKSKKVNGDLKTLKHTNTHNYLNK